MKPVAAVDKGDHWSVISDYSGSARHNGMTEQEWLTEFTTDPYLLMRTSQPGVFAAMAPVGIGDWEKDWSGPFVSSPTKIVLSSDGPPDFDGVPVVNAGGSEKHNILIQAMKAGQVIPSTASLRIMVTVLVPVSNTAPVLSNGQASIAIGPCPGVCDVVVAVADPAGTLEKGVLKIRFK